ncbi:MAG: AAA family ATPase, partial [Candidatus Bathyarchaeota archaeon]|nr:AAA family ATPase [Candidatus Bathyarchaeota archaeon]
MTVIIGPRQVGKTTLIFQLKEELIKKKKISSQN